MLRNLVEPPESVEFAEQGLLVLDLLCPRVCAFFGNSMAIQPSYGPATLLQPVVCYLLYNIIRMFPANDAQHN